MKQVIQQASRGFSVLVGTDASPFGRGRVGFGIADTTLSPGSAVGLGVVPAPLAPYWRYPRRPHMLLTGRTHGLHRDTRRLQDATHRLHNTDAKRTNRQHPAHTVHKVALPTMARPRRRLSTGSIHRLHNAAHRLHHPPAGCTANLLAV